MGLDGMVSKRSDSRYRSGTSRDWIKVKNPEHPDAQGQGKLLMNDAFDTWWEIMRMETAPG
jgi:hypothetical protein